ncbi:hypothetical protein H6F50_12685 [Coleofasciculus sp. FACHB-712]|nr:hypothetical protein [Coleofasciculus sp. FACHB-712]MBD1943200.1 hypothetical protein [Coleofasciculus sp. FACHB-712]
MSDRCNCDRVVTKVNGDRITKLPAQAGNSCVYAALVRITDIFILST